MILDASAVIALRYPDSAISEIDKALYEWVLKQIENAQQLRVTITGFGEFAYKIKSKNSKVTFQDLEEWLQNKGIAILSDEVITWGDRRHPIEIACDIKLKLLAEQNKAIGKSAHKYRKVSFMDCIVVAAALKQNDIVVTLDSDFLTVKQLFPELQLSYKSIPVPRPIKSRK